MTAPILGYEKDPYARQLSTEVTSVGESEGRRFAVLDDTLCYPEGGGQPCDLGTLDDLVIKDVQRVGAEIRHFVHGLIAPGPITLTLDWARRFDHMQQHSAQHLLSSLSLTHLDWETRSFHIGPEVSDIEIGVPPPARHELDRLEELAADVIRKALPIRDRRVTRPEYAEMQVRSRGLPADHEGDIRLVEIEGVGRFDVYSASAGQTWSEVVGASVARDYVPTAAWGEGQDRFVIFANVDWRGL